MTVVDDSVNSRMGVVRRGREGIVLCCALWNVLPLFYPDGTKFVRGRKHNGLQRREIKGKKKGNEPTQCYW